MRPKIHATSSAFHTFLLVPSRPAFTCKGCCRASNHMSGLGGGGWNGKGIPAMRSACVGRCQSSPDPGAGWTWRWNATACAEGGRGREGGPSLSRRQPACPSIGGGRPMQGKSISISWDNPFVANEGPVRIQYKEGLIPIYVFIEMKLLFPKQNYNVLSPSSYTHISVRDLYISRIGLPILLQENMWTNPGNI